MQASARGLDDLERGIQVLARERQIARRACARALAKNDRAVRAPGEGLGHFARPRRGGAARTRGRSARDRSRPDRAASITHRSSIGQSRDRWPCAGGRARGRARPGWSDCARARWPSRPNSPATASGTAASVFSSHSACLSRVAHLVVHASDLQHRRNAARRLPFEQIERGPQGGERRVCVSGRQMDESCRACGSGPRDRCRGRAHARARWRQWRRAALLVALHALICLRELLEREELVAAAAGGAEGLYRA